MAEERLTGVSCPIHCEIFDLGPRPAALVSSSSISYAPSSSTLPSASIFVPGEAVPWANSEPLARTRYFMSPSRVLPPNVLSGMVNETVPLRAPSENLAEKSVAWAGALSSESGPGIYMPPTASPSPNSYTSFAEPAVTSTAYSSDLPML